ncbi:MAG: magnesium transporter CorA family protein, partial [Pseudomonadota bacterium]
MLKKFRIVEGRVIESDETNAEIMVYVSPDESQKSYLVNTLNIDEHTLNSSLDPDELSRLEFEPEHMAMIFKRAKDHFLTDDFLFRVTSVGLFAFKDKLVVVLSDNINIFEGKQFIRIQTIKDIVIRLLYRSIFHYLEHLKLINLASDDLEKKTNIAIDNKY